MTPAEEETIPMEGLFTLQIPEHLLHKLEWEYTQWQDEPLNSYRAWNFFVTAEHLPDWLARSRPRLPKGFGIKAFKKDKPLLRICSHLASGGKHFTPNATHTSVTSTRREEGWVDEDWIEEDWVESDELMVDLTPKEQEALQSPSASITAFSLATDVLAFWQQYFSGTSTP